MPDRSIRRAFWQGARDSLPFLIVVVPFGMIFGVLASEAGWTLAQILGMSVLVIAGASQFTALQLLQRAGAAADRVATALAVNLRMAMYSASIAPYIGSASVWQRALAAYFLTDQTYGVGDQPLHAAAAAQRRGAPRLLLRLRASGLRPLVRRRPGPGPSRARRSRGAGARLRGAGHLHRARRPGAAHAAEPGGGGGLGRGGAGAELDALQPLAAGRRRRARC